jgi:hypothetical protein
MTTQAAWRSRRSADLSCRPPSWAKRRCGALGWMGGQSPLAGWQAPPADPPCLPLCPRPPGLEMNEPATDLAVVCAIASSYFEQPIARDVALVGEVGGQRRTAAPCWALCSAALRLVINLASLVFQGGLGGCDARTPGEGGAGGSASLTKAPEAPTDERCRRRRRWPCAGGAGRRAAPGGQH